MRRLGFVAWLLLAALAAPLAAQDIPGPLQDWQAWVLHDAPQHVCPFLTGSMPAPDVRRCLWPGALAVRVEADGGDFSVAVRVDAPAWLALPGSDAHWPQQVTDHGEPLVVQDVRGVPTVRLARGRHQLAGSWSWSEPPARLSVPETYGLLRLTRDGQPLLDLQRSAGVLQLAASGAAPQAADALALDVYRRLHDGLPPSLETLLQLDVSGTAREITLGPVLPEGFVGTALEAALPARLDPDGMLHLQVRAGRWSVSLKARGTAPLDGTLAVLLPAAPWPAREVWSYADAPDLRQTHAVGQGLDAAQASVPAAWHGLPAFRVDAAHSLAVAVGAPVGEGGSGDLLRVERTLWLDFDGAGFSARDRVRGTLEHPRRIAVAPPWRLEQASAVGQPIPVSQGPDDARGVELRHDELRLDAGLRLPRQTLGAVPVAAWQAPLQSLSAELRLPPGYRLLGAPGASRSPDSWVASWSLLDLFLVALVTLLCGRLLGWPGAVLAAAYLVLAHEQRYAPLLTVLVATGLALLSRALPSGRLRAVAHGATLVTVALVLLWAIPFAAGQLRLALYPQLEHAPLVRPGAAAVTTRFVPPPERPVRKAERAGGAWDMTKSRPAPAAPPVVVEEKSFMAVAPPPPPAPSAPAPPDALADADLGLVQTGPGIPDWNAGNNYALSWSGPVRPQQSMRLVIAPAWLVRLLRLLAVLTLALWLRRLVRSVWPGTRLPRGRAASAVALLLGALLALPGGAQAADTPSPQLLTELRQRLLEAPQCAPACAFVAGARVIAAGDTLEVWLQVQVGATVAVPLPQAAAGLQLTRVAVDGEPAALLGSASGDWLRLERGIHDVHMRWQIRADNLQLAFTRLAPKRIEAHAPGWLLSGLDEARLTGDTLGLARQRRATATAAADLETPTQAFPPYVRVTRELLVGSDWRVHNEAHRIAPLEAGFEVAVPLLPGEHPLDEKLRVADGAIHLSFSAGQDTVRWRSRLEPTASLTLDAPPLAARSEVWRLRTSAVWHVEAGGVPAQPADGFWQWTPLPGDKLRLALSRPEPVTGASMAVDHASLATTVGASTRDLVLGLTLRSTHGGSHALALPTDAQLVGARRGGEDAALTLRAGQLPLPLRAASQDFRLQLRQPEDVGLLTRTPAVDLRTPAANIHLSLHLPDNRWLLWTWGPGNGPAVLYWAELLILVLVAWLLARYAPVPLRLWQWLLLGLGFSTFAWGAFALVALWLILFGLRARASGLPAWPRWAFNLAQIGLALLAVVALLVLIGAVPRGLLGTPDMHIAGNGSNGHHLYWLLDRSDGVLPRAGVFSLPLWCYKAAILAWALWLANALVGWLRWAFRAWTAGGYWRGKAGSETPPPPPPAAD